MSLDELIAINGLLIERETALAGASALELQVSKILGQDYPFAPLPIELPSTRKRKPVRSPKRARKKGPPKIRRLRNDEAAYRVQTLQNGELIQEDLPEFKPFEHLLLEPLPQVQIRKVETISASRRPIEVLFDFENR